jgi:hypothetical protein
MRRFRHLALLVFLFGMLFSSRCAIGDETRPDVKPTPRHVLPIEVIVFLDGTPSAADKQLAALVKKALEAEKSQSPGRKRSFPHDRLYRPNPTDGSPNTIKRQGWTLMIRRVEKLKDGWRATVAVALRATNLRGDFVSIICNHWEVYVSHGGKVTLERDWPDPKDNSQGYGWARM